MKKNLKKSTSKKIPIKNQKSKPLKKPTKTISGVAPVAVMIPPRACEHGACVFCPTLNAPQSYTPESPAVLRAKSVEYDPYKQTKKSYLNNFGNKKIYKLHYYHKRY